MELFFTFYRWAMQMKFRMGLYTIALIFCKAIWNLCCGIYTVSSIDLLLMWLTCFVFAVAESILVPPGKEPTKLRIAAWIVTANILFIGCSLWAGWFASIPLWGAGLLILLLEASLWAMWFGDNVVMRKDSQRLNKQLQQFQKKQSKGEK